MRRLFPALIALLGFAGVSAVRSDPVALTDALRLLEEKRFPEAVEALRELVRVAPENSEACHHLGRALAARQDAAARQEALEWLARAVTLAPANATYLAIYGGEALQHAGRTSSPSFATKGRDALEQAVRLDPALLDAREGLYHFYQRAPWPLGSRTKAEAQLAEIRRRDAGRATALEVLAKVAAKDYPAAFALCEAALARDPDDYAALYQFGRTATVSGQHLERGISCLRRCLELRPTGPASASHGQVWQRLGVLEEKQGRPAEARAAFARALELEPGNRAASDGLRRLR
jgi:tetratricopeptide (TPR) repeat protein